MHDPAALVLHLHLFFGIVVAVRRINKGNHIKRNLRCKGLYHRLLPFCKCVHLLLQLGKPRLPGPGDRLISTGDDILNGRKFCNAGNRHERDNGTAVRIGNQPFVFKGVRAVDLRHNQRNIRL